MTNYEALFFPEDYFIVGKAPTTYKNIVVKVTMRELGEVLTKLREETITPDKEMDFRRLDEARRHNMTLGGEFKFDRFNYGAWVIRKIKQYKPLPVKREEPFVVEM